MTDLLTRLRPGASGGAAARRPLAVDAAVSALAAAGAGLAVCWFVALVGWFASDGGAHGESTSALEVGSGAWLLAHGTDLQVDGVVVTAVPLGLTALCAWAAYRAARWAGAGSEVEDLATLGSATVVLAGTYGIVAMVVALLVVTDRTAPDPVSALLGGSLVAAGAGAAGLVRGSALRADLRALVPGHARAVLFGGLVAGLALWSAGAVLVATAVTLRGDAVATVISRLHLDVAGGGFSLLLVALLAPNLATWGASYLLGGGFAVGTGTVVAPSGVVLGPVPAVPVLAAVPEPGAAPGWLLGVLAVPVACGLLGGWALARRFPHLSYLVTLARGAGAGLVAAVALTMVAVWSGGALGGGRMREVGPQLGLFLLMGVLALGSGAALGAVVTLWWRRRTGTAQQRTDDDLGLQRRLPWRAQRDRRTSRRRGHGDDVPSWARLGVWGASTPPPDRDEDTTYLRP